jgi:hypothetical protein
VTNLKDTRNPLLLQPFQAQEHVSACSRKPAKVQL